MERNEDQIKQYVLNGGKIFSVKSIDTIRDGGTKIIKTTNEDYYINKNNETFHFGYPTEENIITNPLLEVFLIDRIEKYIQECKDDIEQNEKFLLEINNKKPRSD